MEVSVSKRKAQDSNTEIPYFTFVPFLFFSFFSFFSACGFACVLDTFNGRQRWIIETQNGTFPTVNNYYRVYISGGEIDNKKYLSAMGGDGSNCELTDDGSMNKTWWFIRRMPLITQSIQSISTNNRLGLMACFDAHPS